MDIRREAVGLKDELERSLGIAPSIRWGGPGQLDVLVDGTVVFSKKSAGRLPAPGELEQLILTGWGPRNGPQTPQRSGPPG